MAYIDDILIYSAIYHSHVTHVKQVLTRLKENKLFIKREKFEFHVSTTSFLEYIIGQKKSVHGPK